MLYKIIKTYFHYTKLPIMKQIITCAAILALTFSGMAANAQSNNGVSANDKILLKGETVKMQDGKAMLITNGKAVQLQGNVVTGNGSLVKPDGSVVSRAGETVRMKEGQQINPDGNLESAPMKKK